MRALLFLLLATRAAAQAPIPLCPMEGAGIWPPPVLAEGFINCQPQPGAEFTAATCHVRWADPTDPRGHGAWVTSCLCTYHAADLTEGLIPGIWFVGGAKCDPTLAAVTTMIVRGRRWSAGDGGCDAPGNVCPAASGLLAPLAATRTTPRRAPLVATHQRCRVFGDGRPPDCVTVGANGH